MNKEELLQELSLKVSTGEISREEVASRLNVVLPAQRESSEAPKPPSHFSMTKMLYVLGVAIVIVGIVIFVQQIWEYMGSFSRVTITLGLGILMTALGSMLHRQKPENYIGPIFHFIGGVLIPGGAMVTLSELNIDFSPLWPLVITFGAIFVFYLLLNAFHKHAILTLLTIANGTAFIYLLVEAMVAGAFYMHRDLYAYLTMAVGASYILLGYAFHEGWNRRLTGALYFLGTTGFFVAAFSQVPGSLPWQLSYFLLVFCGLFLSVFLKSRSILVMSTLFLVVHVSYITGKYFADSLGWPISLVVLGFVFIGLGYASITINKKYIKEAR